MGVRAEEIIIGEGAPGHDNGIQRDSAKLTSLMSNMRCAVQCDSGDDDDDTWGSGDDDLDWDEGDCYGDWGEGSDDCGAPCGACPDISNDDGYEEDCATYTDLRRGSGDLKRHTGIFVIISHWRVFDMEYVVSKFTALSSLG